jgi:predicted negative regulator of RcsB-dependent stress response
LATNSVIQDHLGDVLFAVNDQAGAIAAWERALAGDGESIDTEAIRRKIERTRQR